MPISTVKLRRGRVHWMVRADTDMDTIEPLLRDPDGEIMRQHEPIRDTILVTLTRIAQPRWERSRLLRRTNYGKPLARVRDFFRVAAPIRAFRNGLKLEAAGISTPRVIAAGIVRKLQKPVVGYLLVEEIRPATALVDYVKAHRGVPHAAVERIARMVAQLHHQGFVHGDLTIGNVLLDERLEPWLVDLERARAVAYPVGWRGAVEDFFRFARHVPVLGPGAHFGALRLMMAYCRERGWAGREREFAADILRRLKQKIKGYGLGPK